MSTNPYAQFQPHAAALARNRIQYVDGKPVRPRAPQQLPQHQFPPPQYVGQFMPAVPLAPVYTGPGPAGPNPAVTEQYAVAAALGFEADAMQFVYGKLPVFAKAAAEWVKARDAATQISFSLAASNPVASDNAKFRAQAYENRRRIDDLVATGQKQHPRLTGEVQGDGSTGWNWPPIYQAPDSSGGGQYLPPAPIPVPVPNPSPPDVTPTEGGGIATTLVKIGGVLAGAVLLLYLFKPRAAAALTHAVIA